MAAAAFLGSWIISRHATSSDDEALLSFLTGFSAETIEDHWKTLCRIPDTPVWEAGDCRGVVSKYDIFFALSHTVTRFLWNRFQQVVQKVLPPVLSEKNAESVNGVSTGRYSSIVRRGVSETVVFLVAQGKTLFKDLPGADEASWVQWVQGRLMPITAKRLETDSRYLAFYAEIAPTVFESFGKRPQSIGLRSVETDAFDQNELGDSVSLDGTFKRLGMFGVGAAHVLSFGGSVGTLGYCRTA